MNKNPKAKLLKECVELLKKPRVKNWYDKNLLSKPQGETINSLKAGVSSEELSLEEALSMALIVGFQWLVEFENTP